MTKEQLEIVIVSLQMRICYLETGTVTHRQSDCRKEDGTKFGSSNIKPKILTVDQMRLIVQIDDLLREFEKQRTNF